MLVDVHCHINHKQFEGKLRQVIANAKKAGVTAAICAGVNPDTNREVLELGKKYDIVKPALGIYPVDGLGLVEPGLEGAGLSHSGPFDVDKEIAWIKEQKDQLIAVSEIGLDYKWVTDAALQRKERENFEKCLKLAEQIRKPVIVHSRNAEHDVIDMLMSSHVKHKVLHCFMGNKRLIKKAADAGFFFSIPSIITRLQHFQMLVDMVPLTQLLTETDAPYLSPNPPEPSEPAHVALGVEQIAKIKSFTKEETANAIWLNYQRVFGA